MSESFDRMRVLFSFSSPDISLLHLFHFDSCNKENCKLGQLLQLSQLRALIGSLDCLRPSILGDPGAVSRDETGRDEVKPGKSRRDESVQERKNFKTFVAPVFARLLQLACCAIGSQIT